MAEQTNPTPYCRICGREGERVILITGTTVVGWQCPDCADKPILADELTGDIRLYRAGEFKSKSIGFD